jgi:AcrR family transcriptional regulator
MANKTKFSENDIMEAAFSVVRKKGMAELSTRSIARQLGCSTMPVYSFFKSKKNLTERIVERAYAVLYDYQTTRRTGDAFLDMGIGYVLFAKEERYLFRCINDQLHVGTLKKYNDQHFVSLIGKLSEYPILKGMTNEQIRRFFMQGWTYSHGLAQLVNIGYFSDMGVNEISDLFLYTGKRYIRGALELEDKA